VTDPVFLAREIRKTILTQSRRAHVGHIGSALSIADAIAALFCGPLADFASNRGPDRHRFILSKGHAALALYALLANYGLISEAELDTFCCDGSALGVHPEHGVPGIDFSTGSLGQGLSVGAGAALAARLDRSSRRVFVLLSDAECNEGSVWEAVAFAAHHRLSNLVAVVDENGQQAFGYTKDVLYPTPLAERWKSFGWNVQTVDGHNAAEMMRTLTSTDPSAPLALIARTTFGKGVPFMENQIKWHYSPMSDREFADAMAAIEQ
jgi:transketolase